MNKYQLPFMRLQSTLDLGIKSQISTEFGTAIINKKQLQDDMILLGQLVDRATPMTIIIDNPEEEYLCPKCSHEVDSSFCSWCGQALWWVRK